MKLDLYLHESHIMTYRIMGKTSRHSPRPRTRRLSDDRTLLFVYQRCCWLYRTQSPWCFKYVMLPSADAFIFQQDSVILPLRLIGPADWPVLNLVESVERGKRRFTSGKGLDLSYAGLSWHLRRRSSSLKLSSLLKGRLRLDQIHENEPQGVRKRQKPKKIVTKKVSADLRFTTLLSELSGK